MRATLALNGFIFIQLTLVSPTEIELKWYIVKNEEALFRADTHFESSTPHPQSTTTVFQ